MVKRKKQSGNTRRWLLYGVLGVAVVTISWIARQGTTTPAQLVDGGTLDHAEVILSSCTGSSVLFPKNRVNALTTWKNAYHKNVAAVVSAVQVPSDQVMCSVSQSENVPIIMSALASQLPPWKPAEKLETLRSEDVGSVLLEYLRLYECALQERAFELPIRASEEVVEQERDKGNAPQYIPIVGSTEEAQRELTFIRQEMAISRPALHRTLLFLGGTMRLGSLGQNMDCLARASADLRNSLGLAAEASACLPRVWDAQGNLRNATNTADSDE